MMGSKGTSDTKQLTAGYTIIEVLIVLAVTASMFVAVITAFGGRQSQIQFTQAVRDFDSRLQDLSNDISTGFFNNAGNTGCIVNSVDGTIKISNDLVDDAVPQGKNEECVFIGKVIQFDPDADSNPDEVNVVTVVGKRSLDDGSSVDKLVDSSPTINADNIERELLEWGLRVTRVTNSAGTSNHGAIIFLTSFSSSLGSGANQSEISNNQLVRSIGVGSGLNQSLTPSIATAVNELTDASFQTEDDIFICLQKADGNKRAAIVIGENNTAATTVLFDDQRVVDLCE